MFHFRNLMMLAVVIAVTAIATSAQSPNASAVPTRTTVDASQDDLIKMLDKALGEVEASRTAIKALQAENEALRRLDTANIALVEAKDKVIAAQDKQIERLTAIKCSKTSFFWGIISKKTCY